MNIGEEEEYQLGDKEYKEQRDDKTK